MASTLALSRDSTQKINRTYAIQKRRLHLAELTAARSKLLPLAGAAKMFLLNLGPQSLLLGQNLRHKHAPITLASQMLCSSHPYSDFPELAARESLAGPPSFEGYSS
jgi:hypothetical protein